MTANGSDVWLTLLLQQTFGSYEPIKFIHKGEFGYVIEAKDIRSRRRSAIKVLRPFTGPGAEIEFDDERRFLQRLSRATSIVTIYESSKISVDVDLNGHKVSMPLAYHAIELAPGCLTEYVTDEDIRNKLPWLDKVRFWRGAVRGIHQMHLKGIVHRDLKSSNCLVMPGRDRLLTCKLTDLGRSRDLEETPRFSPECYATGRGDRRFSAPELLFIQGRDDPQTQKCADLYGLGSLLFEIATGQPITFLTLGYGPDLAERNLQEARRGHLVDLDSLRPAYARSVALFGQAVPSAIRTRASQLVAKLCDPVPERRLPAVGLGRRVSPGQALEWLLREADILTKQLHVPSARRTRRRTP